MSEITTACAFAAARRVFGDAAIAGASSAVYERAMARCLPATEHPEEAPMLLRLLSGAKSIKSVSMVKLADAETAT